MDAADLQGGFKLGEWLVEPRHSRISGAGGVRPLEPDQLKVLLCLAEHHGEGINRHALREQVWPGRTGSEKLLRESIRSLREALGGSPQDQRHVASIGRSGYALVAHIEPVASVNLVLPAAGPPAKATLVGRLQSFIIELRRRNVFKVAGGYLLGMWVVLQVAQTTFAPLRFPDWWMSALTILAVLGLPIVTVLAWSYEITPGGIVLDEGIDKGVRLPRARRAIAPALVAGVSLMAAVTGYAWWRTIDRQPEVAADGRRVEPSAQSIAVLPFLDMSPTGGAAYLGDGLSEELSSDLAKLPGMRVAARTSAFAYKGKDLDVRKIGEQLGVRYVLEGSVRREGERVRVTAQLIDSVSGFHAWTESYDRPWQDLISIQQEISGAIAQQLQAVITPEVAAQLKTAPTENPRAYDFYLAGLSQLRQGGSLSRVAEAEDLFKRSLEADPGFARAQAGLCEVAVARYNYTNATENVSAAENACRDALEADATLKETELALGRLYLMSGRQEQAEAVYRSLLRRAPRDADVHIGLGRALARSNRLQEAERSFREAIIVEPGYWASYNALGGFLFGIGRNQEAADAYARVTELAPGNPMGFNNLGAARLAAGELEASAKAFEQSKNIEPSRAAYSNLGTLYFYLGRRDDGVAMYSKAIELAPEDYRLWGGRADTKWFMPNHRDDARADYRRATALAEKSLAVDANDADTWGQLGYYYGRLGNAELAARSTARALELAPHAPFVLYCAAVAAADRGDRQEAARLVRLAIEQGQSRALLAADPSLKGIPTS
jgi:TolB-like protein/tetratricopeptide (TPR) repeat protein/DNA-binding winged helix-turn-helix (wHTH) protein